MLRQVEDENFRALTSGEVERARIRFQRIARGQSLAVYADRATRHVNVCLPARGHLVTRPFGALEEAGLHTRVLVDAHGAVGAIGRSDEPQAAALLGGGELLLLVLGRDAADVRLDPDLEEVRDAKLVVVELAVLYAAPSAQPLHIAGHDG